MGDKLQLALGYSHPIEIDPPTGISFEVETPVRLAVVGIDKELVGQMAAKIRATRKPEPYKGKGVRYAGEQGPPQGGQGRQDRREEVAMTTDRHPFRRRAPSATSDSASACRAPRAGRGWPCSGA